MARPQTENLNAFEVSKTKWNPEGLPDGAEISILNEDPDGGALSALVHLPKGWSWSGPGICESDLDLFVVLDSVDETFDYLISNVEK